MTALAIIAPVVNVREHPNADRLNLATVVGHQVVLGKDVEEGTLGVFFPCDLQLSHDMCMANNLYRKHPETQEPMGGFFDANRRVRAQKFRKEQSEGYWTSLGSLSWTGIDVLTLAKGYQFLELNGHLICNKYYSPATRSAMARNKQGKKTPASYAGALTRHFDTKKLRYNVGNVPLDALITVTEKIHGTSGRTGHMRTKQPLKLWQRIWNRLFWWISVIAPEYVYTYLTGTRNVVLSPDQTAQSHTHPDTYRLVYHDMFKDMGLAMGETVYYEIVGFSEPGVPIMPGHGLDDKQLQRLYKTNVMNYDYGCDRDKGTNALYVYRITMSSPDGTVVEYSWAQVVARCKELGLATVPLYRRFIYDGDTEGLMRGCQVLADGNSALDDGHTREGVCLRVEAPGYDNIFKYKGFVFCDLEGIAKNSDSYVDPEEIA